jgi:Carboxypeptidase regulatory-like domain
MSRAAPLIPAIAMLLFVASRSPATAAPKVPSVQNGISGVVTSAKGPEAGVWVIAQTKDLGVGFVKTVVTDDEGRYVLPDLPKASYKVWVRGFGLIDSKPVDASRGQKIDLSAVVAPDAKSAAQYYPAYYWYSLVRPPAANKFPGTGPDGNGIAKSMKTQGQWTANMQECIQCHQMGSQITRAPALSTPEFWKSRVKQARPIGDPSMVFSAKGYTWLMGLVWNHFGDDAAAEMFSDWTTRVEGGELPHEAPPRPTGVERNVVLSQWDWGPEGSYYHDSVASDRRNPSVNANGPIYGILSNRGKLGILDPVKNTFREVDLPGADKEYVHTIMMDQKGRVWLPNLGPVLKTGAPWEKRPDFCTKGELSKYAMYYPSKGPGSYFIYVYDPATEHVDKIPSCLSGAHIWFGNDEDNTLYFTGDVVGWMDTKVWDETHNPAKAQGWCPMVVNTKSKGRSPVDPNANNWKMLGEPSDEPKDTLITESAYGLGVNPVDGSVWFALKAYPGAITRLERGTNPPLTCKTEYYQAPIMPNGEYAAGAPHDLGFDSKGIAYVTFTTGHIGLFDRSKCKKPSGSTEDLGQSCPEGWTIIQLTGPRFDGAPPELVASDYVYATFVDYFNTAGLGKERPIFAISNSDSLLALDPATQKWTRLHVPYPMGFYSRWLDGRIDDPKAGWKGRGLWTTYSTVPVWHQEGVTSAQPQAVHFQLRGSPLDY